MYTDLMEVVGSVKELFEEIAMTRLRKESLDVKSETMASSFPLHANSVHNWLVSLNN
jgi:hypothetical protein